MTIITPAELKSTLKLQGIPESDLEDETVLQSLIDLKINEITSLTNIPVNPVPQKQIIRKFDGNLFESDWYPILKVNSFKIDGVELTEDDYVLDESTGIFYLNNYHNGLLVIEYCRGLSDETITSRINPLIADMILYSLTSLDSNKGEISSIHESEQSISYDTGNSLGNRIYARIDDLKSTYNYVPRVKWLV